MTEIYSNADNCLELARHLKKKMGNKIDFYGSVYQEVISGKYFSHYKDPHSELDYLFEEGLPFYYKFCKEGFLRIGIGSFYPHNNSMGEKLAALSSFYEVLSEQYGEPTVFYTTKDDDEGVLSLQWSFANKEEDIQSLRNGSYFDDAEVDELIVFGESRIQINGYQLSDITGKWIARQLAKQFGVPIELIGLVDENIEDFVKYKTGKKIRIPEWSKNDGVPVTSFQKKMSLEKRRK